MKKLKTEYSISFLKEKLKSELEEYAKMVIYCVKNSKRENELYNSIIILNKQIKLSEDCISVYNIIKNP